MGVFVGINGGEGGTPGTEACTFENEYMFTLIGAAKRVYK